MRKWRVRQIRSLPHRAQLLTDFKLSLFPDLVHIALLLPWRCQPRLLGTGKGLGPGKQLGLPGVRHVLDWLSPFIKSGSNAVEASDVVAAPGDSRLVPLGQAGRL